LWARIGLFILSSLICFALLLGNLLVADRLSPVRRMGLPADPRLATVTAALRRAPLLLRAGLAAVFALLFGSMTIDHWYDWVLFRNSVPFGVDDPLFGRDVGFYVFRLPFLSFAVDWLFAVLVLALLLSVASHVLGGGIRLRSPRPQVSRAARGHLSLLLAVLALVRAVSYYLDRFELTYSTRGVVDGAGFTDVNAQLPAISLLIAISLLAAALFVYSIWRRGWVIPAVAVGLWGLVSVVAGVAYPAFIQRF